MSEVLASVFSTSDDQTNHNNDSVNSIGVVIDWWTEGVILPSICAVGILGKFIRPLHVLQKLLNSISILQEILHQYWSWQTRILTWSPALSTFSYVWWVMDITLFIAVHCKHLPWQQFQYWWFLCFVYCLANDGHSSDLHFASLKVWVELCKNLKFFFDLCLRFFETFGFCCKSQISSPTKEALLHKPRTSCLKGKRVKVCLNDL